MVTLAIHTVFVLRENILFLEDWLKYHIAIGFKEFYLYDNSSSLGRSGSSVAVNKYGFNFQDLTNSISDNLLVKCLTHIFRKYKRYIHYQKWEPIDSSGNFCYGQKEAILDYIKNRISPNTWTAFIDMDEFIYSKHNLEVVIRSLQHYGYGLIKLSQKKFDDRFNNIGQPVYNIIDCIEGIDTSSWAPKCIIHNVMFDTRTDDWDVHTLPILGAQLEVSIPSIQSIIL